MAGAEGSRALAELEAQGLAVVRGACGPETAARAAAEVHGALERMLRLPLTMAERARAEAADASAPRHFVPFATEPMAAVEEAGHRRDFRAPLTGGLEAALREALNGPAGAAVAGALGGRAERAELRELLGIVSEPGAAAQALHADGAWGPASPRVVTLFVALVDVTDESAGRDVLRARDPRPAVLPGRAVAPAAGSRGCRRGSGGGDVVPARGGRSRGDGRPVLAPRRRQRLGRRASDAAVRLVRATGARQREPRAGPLPGAGST